MNPDERLKLQEMIKENNVEDQTNKIREIKHSIKIRHDVNAYLSLLTQYPKSKNKEFFKQLCLKNCNFLYNNYTDIYNKMVKDELNINMFKQFVDVLEEIENNKLDQHEGSFKIGKLLKEIYIDSALRKEKTIDLNNPVKKPNTGKNVNYLDYKIKN